MTDGVGTSGGRYTRFTGTGDGGTGMLVAALRAATGTEGRIRHLTGYTTAGDGGEGLFRWSTTAATDDGGTVFNRGGFGSSSAGWRRIFSGDINVKWFGAKGDNTTDDTTAIQRAVNVAVAEASENTDGRLSGTVLFPPGKYKLTAAIVIAGTRYASGGDTLYQYVSLHLKGISAPFQFGFNGASIYQSTATQAAFLVQAARTVVFENLSLLGRNVWTAPADPLQYWDDEWSGTPWIGNSSRDNRYSPHAGIVVDPFHATVASGDQYPGLSAYYVNTTAGGGSSIVRVIGCFFENFVVGLAVSTNGTTQNAENVPIADTSFLSCKVALAIGQDQSRNVTLHGCAIAGARDAINLQAYGEGNGTPPLVFGGNIGNVRNVIVTAASGSNAIFSGTYMGESIMCVGHFSGARAVFHKCEFGFWGTRTGKPAYPRVFASADSRPIFQSCVFSVQDPQVNETLFFLAGEFSDDCKFDYASPGTSTRLWIIGTPYDYRFRGVRTATTDATTVEEGEAIVRKDYESNFDVFRAPQGGSFLTALDSSNTGLKWIDAHSYPVDLGLITPTVNADGTARLEQTDIHKKVAVGDIVMTTSNVTSVIDGLPAQPVGVCLGKVSAVGTDYVETVNVPTYVPAGSATQYYVVVHPVRRIHEPTTGTLASTTSITNVSPVTYWATGQRIKDEDAVLGSTNYVSNVSGTTIAVAAEAVIGSGTVYLYDQPVYNVLRSFWSQQAKLGIPGTNIGEVNGALQQADVHFQVWTPRIANGALIGAGSTDKASANGAWCSIGGWGSTHATTAYRSMAGLMFGGNASVRMLVVACDADGTNPSVVGYVDKSGNQAWGTAPASAGVHRVGHGFTLQGNTNTPGTNRKVLSWGDAANDTTNLGDANAATRVTGSSVKGFVGATEKLSLGAASDDHITLGDNAVKHYESGGEAWCLANGIDHQLTP